MQAGADDGVEFVDTDEGWRPLPPPAPAAAPAPAQTLAELAWARVYALLQRLTFKRRQLGLLGQWLKAIKARGRQLPDDGAAGRRA